MNSNALIAFLVLVIVVVAGVMIYDRMHEPRPLEDRLDAAVEELKDGNLGQAADEVNNATPAEQVTDAVNEASEEVKEAVSPTY